MTIHSQVRHKHFFITSCSLTRYHRRISYRPTEHVLHKTERTCRTEQNMSYKNTHHTERNLCYKQQNARVTYICRTHVKHRGFRLLLFCFDYIVLQITNIYICFHMKKGINNSEKLQCEYDT